MLQNQKTNLFEFAFRCFASVTIEGEVKFQKLCNRQTRKEAQQEKWMQRERPRHCQETSSLENNFNEICIRMKDKFFERELSNRVNLEKNEELRNRKSNTAYTSTHDLELETF